MKNYRVLFVICIVSVFAISYPLMAHADFNTDLYYGVSSSSDVEILQTFLSQMGLYGGPINGNYFLLTKKAVASFQTQEGITPASGYFGQESRNIVNELMAAQVNASSTDTNTSTDTKMTSDLVPVSIDDFSSTTNALDQEISDLTAQYQNLQNDVTALAASVDSINSELATLQASVTLLQSSIVTTTQTALPVSQTSVTTTPKTSTTSTSTSTATTTKKR